MKRLLLTIVALLAIAAGAAMAELLPIPSGVGTSGQLLAVTSDNNNVQGTSTPSVTSVTVGSGTAITKIALLTVTTTQFVLAANSCSQQAYTVTGLTTGDKIFINPTFAMGAEAFIASVNVAVADTIDITFCNPHAVAVDPEVGVINIMALRS